MEPSPAQPSAAIATAEAGGDAAGVRRAATPAWLISVITHSAILAVFSTVVFLTRESESEAPPVRPVAIPPLAEQPRPKPDDPTTTSDTLTIPIDAQDDTRLSSVSDLVVDEDKPETTEDDVAAEVPKGDPNAISDEAMGSDGMLAAIGPGGHDKGQVGIPDGGGYRRARKAGTATHGTEVAVNRALRWFKRHQSVDGRWDVDGYQANCTAAGQRCEPGTDHTGIDGDIACTAYAVLCFVSHGYDHRTPSQFKGTVKKGVDWLVANQKADGSWGDRNYENAIATMTLADAYSMSNDPALHDVVQKGVNVILAREAKEANGGGYGLGWDYVQPNPSRNDASVSGWNVMALKSAKAGGLDVGTGFEGARNYLKKAWEAANPNFAKLDPYKDDTSFPYTWDATSGKVDVAAGGAKEHDMAAVGALCAVFLGHKAGDIMLETLCNHIVKYQSFTTWPVNTYYLYYDSFALAQCDAKRYQKWAGPVRDLLTNAQRSDDCFDGSWDYAATEFPGHETGRLLSTAYCCLALENAYRFGGVAAEHEKERDKLKRTVGTP